MDGSRFPNSPSSITTNEFQDTSPSVEVAPRPGSSLRRSTRKRVPSSSTASFFVLTISPPVFSCFPKHKARASLFLSSLQDHRYLQFRLVPFIPSLTGRIQPSRAAIGRLSRHPRRRQRSASEAGRGDSESHVLPETFVSDRPAGALPDHAAVFQARRGAPEGGARSGWGEGSM